MLRVFKHYIPLSLMLLALAEGLVLFFSIEAAVHIRMYMIDGDAADLGLRLPEMLTYVAIVFVVLVALGLYESDAARDLKVTLVRLSVAMIISVALLAFIFFFFPDVATWRSILVIALALSFAGILLARLVFADVVDLRTFKSNVLILGAGQKAQTLVDLSAAGSGAEFRVAACVAMPGEDSVVTDVIERSDFNSLEHLVEARDIREIVLAMEERRGALPVQDLLACKLHGCRITNFVNFVEKAKGHVDLDSLQPSWLIFSGRFGRRSRYDNLVKRMVDISASLLILIFSLPILIFTAIAVKISSRGPVFYRQERVGLGGNSFEVIKFRSMRIDAEKDGVPKWADENDPRVTPIGNVIRAARIDEIPQIFNVLRGDMSFVGPRPERPFFVDTLVGQIKFYNERHTVKPGITGWAQLNYPYGASVADAKRKLEYDLYYIQNYSVFLDFLILLQTVRVIFWPQGVR